MKLGDFGLATYLGSAPNEKRKTFCGTLDYISPEMFNRRGHDYKIDIWSIGILIYEICSGTPPFESENYNETMKKVCQVSPTRFCLRKHSQVSVRVGRREPCFLHAVSGPSACTWPTY